MPGFALTYRSCTAVAGTPDQPSQPVFRQDGGGPSLRRLNSAALMLLTASLLGCGSSHRDNVAEANEARLRRCAVEKRSKPLELDATYEAGGRTVVSWIGPIYPRLRSNIPARTDLE